MTDIETEAERVANVLKDHGVIPPEEFDATKASILKDLQATGIRRLPHSDNEFRAARAATRMTNDFLSAVKRLLPITAEMENALKLTLLPIAFERLRPFSHPSWEVSRELTDREEKTRE